MDPLSITVSCVTLVTAVSRVTYSLTGFIREWRDASADLEAISQELLSMQMVIWNLRNILVTEESTLPPKLREQILGILHSCNQVVVAIEASMTSHAHSRLGKGGYWTLGGGKENMAKHRSSLEVHKSALEITLELVSISISRDIKNDTTKILEEMVNLGRRLPIDQARSRRSSPDRMLKKELDDFNNFTETYQYEDEAYISDSSSEIDNQEINVRSASRVFRHSISQDQQTAACTNTSIPIPFIRLTPYYRPQTHEPIPRTPTILCLLSHVNTVHLGRYSKTRNQEPNFVGFASRVVSRMHCDIWHTDGEWYIRDNKSLAGTWLNCERLSETGKTSRPHRLRDGDVVQLGMDYHGGYDTSKADWAGCQSTKKANWRHVKLVVNFGQ